MHTDSGYWAERITRAFFGRWQRWRDRRSEIAELASAGEDEIARLAADLALSSQELQQLVATGPGGADLLYERCKALGIDAARLQSVPELKRELERCCSLCASKPECAHDLEANPSGAQWSDYCPNEATLATLRPSEAH